MASDYGWNDRQVQGSFHNTNLRTSIILLGASGEGRVFLEVRVWHKSAEKGSGILLGYSKTIWSIHRRKDG